MILTNGWFIFSVGFAGGIAVELIYWFDFFQSIVRPASPATPIIPRIEGFVWIIYAVLTILVASLGGLLALLYGITQGIVAFHIGASGPLIIRTFAKTIPRLE